MLAPFVGAMFYCESRKRIDLSIHQMLPLLYNKCYLDFLTKAYPSCLSLVCLSPAAGIAAVISIAKGEIRPLASSISHENGSKQSFRSMHESVVGQ
jgi:hypothetical protein